jgi:hypothetical protein
MEILVKNLGGSWCYLDDKGIVLKSFNVSEAFPFEGGMAAIRLYSCIGYINKRFKIVVEPKYGNECSDFKEGMAIVCTPGNLCWEDIRYGYINKKGKEIIPLIFESAMLFSEGLATVQKNGKWGAINKKGEEAIEFKYDMLSHCVNGLYLFAIGGRIGILNKKRKELIISEELKVEENTFSQDLLDGFFDLRDMNLLKEKEIRWVLNSNEGIEMFTWRI